MVEANAAPRHKMSKCKAVLIGHFLNFIDLQDSLEVFALTCTCLGETLADYQYPIELQVLLYCGRD